MAGKKGMKWPISRRLSARRSTNLRKLEVLEALKEYVKVYGRAPHIGSKLGTRIHALYGCSPSTLLYTLDEVE